MGKTTSKPCSVCGKRADMYSRECEKCKVVYCSKCKQLYMKRLSRKRWMHAFCIENGKVNKNPHRMQKKGVIEEKKRCIEGGKVNKNPQRMKKLEVMEKRSRVLEREERFEDALRIYLHLAEIIMPMSRSDLKFASKLDRILSRAENLKQPIYVRLSSDEKLQLIRNENDKEWTYRKGTKWRKLGKRSVVVDDRDYMYGKGQIAANNAFEILRRRGRVGGKGIIVRQKQNVIVSTKKSILRIASWNIKFLTATSHHVGDTVRIERRLKRIASTIMSNHFDVIVIQEVCAGGGGREALKMLCDHLNRNFKNVSPTKLWSYRVWPDRYHGRVRDKNNVSGARNEMYAIVWKQQHVVVNANLIPRERESDWTLSPEGRVVKASSTGDYELSSFTKIGLFRVGNLFIATTHASIWSPHSDKKAWARSEVKRLESICKQAQRHGLRFVLMGDFNIEMNKMKHLSFYKDMMVLDTQLPTMTSGKRHNDNAFATSNVKIVNSRIVPVPDAHKQWVKMECAALSENNKKNHMMTRRARSQFESRLWSDHRPIYLDIVRT